MRAALLSALLLLAPPATAACVDCACGDITVTADTEALAEAACDAAGRALDRLAEAGLTDRPPLEIRAFSELPENHDGPVAVFEAEARRISILAPEVLAAHVVSASAFSRVSPETQFAGLIAHELTHALLVERFGPRKAPMAHEYLAYAIQVDIYPEIERARFLEGRDMSVPIEPRNLSDILLLLAPDAFAARAWALFQAEGAGPEAVERAMTGEIDFPTSFHGLE